ncbi:MerR family transcriptional regulator [Goodfellowiella coeruleoviolacea]|uniref:DNA-binding transcriptional regulator, MerR family n=1 Tax=Goodfellowiella coeruleoviolacea TaxID=334858 RepID=A0AAE3GH98_9PSEU|nr:MerR family transcriptional regulator [Goodfellowiella coeruleoviolacea]MCP2167340.1 DNA-binding transcriptional regulator, MerR family [Goodfellowiella coeruleoviolacea]
MSDALLRIGELAARAGVSSRTVDYYTNLGLLAPARRTAGNYRLYQQADVERIHLIQRLEGQGVPLEEIASAFTAPTGEVADILDRIDNDLQALHAVVETAPAEVHGLLAAIATRVHSLITVALQIPPDLPML